MAAATTSSPCRRTSRRAGSGPSCSTTARRARCSRPASRSRPSAARPARSRRTRTARPTSTSVPTAPRRQGAQLAADGSRQGLVDDPAPLQPASVRSSTRRGARARSSPSSRSASMTRPRPASGRGSVTRPTTHGGRRPMTVSSETLRVDLDARPARNPARDAGASSMECRPRRPPSLVYDHLDFVHAFERLPRRIRRCIHVRHPQGFPRHRREGQPDPALLRADGVRIRVPDGERRHRLLPRHRSTSRPGRWSSRRRRRPSASSTTCGGGG